MRLPTRLKAVVVSMLAFVAPVPAWADGQAERVPAVPMVDADPALWVIRDDDTTIYLFGTVHLLKPGLSWFDEAVAAAYAASDELRLEILPQDNPNQLGALLEELGRDPTGRTMADRLSPEDHALYVARLKAMGIEAEQLESFEPWFIGMNVAIIEMVRRGYLPEHGADEILQKAAKASGKRITAFETAEEQLRILDSIPEVEQLIGLMDFVRDESGQAETWDKLVAAWSKGDAELTGQLMNAEMGKAPAVAKLLLADRNRRWVVALQERMKQPGTVFVAVGAGHLVGKDSVQSLLKARGIEAVPVPY